MNGSNGEISKPADKKKDLGPPLKILVADDTAVNLALATKLLKRRGHEITSVEDGLQAFETFKKASFDVVLMDIHMPVMDGLESTAKIREFEASQPSRPPTPIIAMTANAMNGDEQKCYEAGMDGYISKPIRPAGLIDAIKNTVSQT